MALNAGALYVDLGLNSAQFQQGLRGSTRDLQKFKKDSEGMFVGMAKNFGKGLFAGIAAGGIAGIVSQIANVAKGVAAIGDEAARAGVSIRAFQELAYVATQNRVAVDSLVDGLKELSLRADEFIRTGAGPAAEAFGRLGLNAETLKQKLKDPSELFLTIIGRLQQLDRAAQIRIADEVFGGTGGERFVQLINQGEDSLRATIQEAHKLGNVMSDEVVKRADELDRKFNAITTSVGNGLKLAIVSAATELQNFINAFRKFEQDYQARLNATEAGAMVGSLAGAAGSGAAPTSSTTPKTGRLPAAEPVLPSNADLVANYLRRYREELALTNRERAIGAEAERILSDAAKRGLDVTRQQAEALAAEKVAREERDAAMKKSASESERTAKRTEHEREKIAELITELEQELAVVGATDEAKRALAATRMAGAAATDEERNRIIALNEAIHQGEEAEQRRADAMEFAGNLALDGVNSLTQAINTGSEALDGFISKLIEAVAQAALLGQGPLAGLFGGGAGLGAFPAAPIGGGFESGIGLYDKGGYTGSGPRKKPAGIVHAGEVVFNQDDVRRFGGPGALDALRLNGPMTLPRISSTNGGSSSGPQRVDINVNVTGAQGNAEIQAMVADGVSRGIGQFSQGPHFTNATAKALSDIKRRGIRA